MSRMILMAVIVANATMFAAQPLGAQDCVRGYESCLNDTHDTRGLTRVLADIECFAQYVGCVKALLE